MNEAEWEGHYRALADSAAASAEHRTGPDPRVKELVERYAPYGSAKRALDLACGSGANTLWLAEQGWYVTAVDRSPAAIELVQKDAAARGVRMATQIADLEAHEFKIEPAAWDLIVMCRYLQVDLFESALLGLAPGGLLIVIALLSDPANAASQRFRVRAGELTFYFENRPGFAIVRQRDDAPSPDDYARRQAFAEIAVRRECE